MPVNVSGGKRFWKEAAFILKEMLQKDHVDGMVSEGNERGTLHKSADKKKSISGSDTEEIASVWTCAEWMRVKRSCWCLVLWTEITSLRTTQVDDIINWFRASLQELSYSTQDRTKWNKIIKEASDSLQQFMMMMMMKEQLSLKRDWFPITHCV